MALLASGALLSVPAAALADATSARPHAALSFSRVFRVHGQTVTVPGRWFQLSGTVHPYVAGQTVTLKAFRDGHVFKTATRAVRSTHHGSAGAFTWRLGARHAGRVTVVADHRGNSALGAFKAQSGVDALSESVHYGSTGRFVELLQQRLRALHFYVPESGVYDQHTGWAVDAYHRILRWGTSDAVSPGLVAQLLNGRGTFHVRFPHQGRHAEGNLSLQLLALIDGSKVQWIYPISSGKPSTPTILGSYRVYRRTPGYLPDGMYYSDFFVRGYAIHGYDPAPNYPASHGCMRLPIIDAIFVFHWLAMGDWVDIYYT
ncbi:MAG TPA: L,D-transpeptidase [Solirubrobacteraceae bacterium]|nr:L,D-transpeptidase [Solirubrobacteraceae bacterium]